MELNAWTSGPILAVSLALTGAFILTALMVWADVKSSDSSLKLNLGIFSLVYYVCAPATAGVYALSSITDVLLSNGDMLVGMIFGLLSLAGALLTLGWGLKLVFDNAHAARA